jgi:hypothetical protein
MDLLAVMTQIKNVIVAAALACAFAAWGQDAAQPKLRTVKLNAGMHVIQAEVAYTPQQLSTGLMFRREMGQKEGMLFVYDEPAVHCFWMKNTVLPLSIAFIGDDGTVVNIADMQPQTLDSHCSARPVRFALEMNQGWFAQRGIKPGFKLGGAPFSK